MLSSEVDGALEEEMALAHPSHPHFSDPSPTPRSANHMLGRGRRVIAKGTAKERLEGDGGGGKDAKR